MTASRSNLLRTVAMAKGAVLAVGVGGALSTAVALGVTSSGGAHLSTPTPGTGDDTSGQVPAGQQNEQPPQPQVSNGSSDNQHAQSSGS